MVARNARLHGSESAIWKPPELSWLKANVDGAFKCKSDQGKLGLGLVWFHP